MSWGAGPLGGHPALPAIAPGVLDEDEAAAGDASDVGRIDGLKPPQRATGAGDGVEDADAVATTVPRA